MVAALEDAGLPSSAINLVAVVFMFFAGINFSLHFFAARYVSVKHYTQDPEFRAYAFFLAVVSVMVIAAFVLMRPSSG